MVTVVPSNREKAEFEKHNTHKITDDWDESIEIRYHLLGTKRFCMKLTMIGIVGPTAFLTALNRPRDGVRPPPFVRFEQSSSLSAPPRTALFDHDRIMSRRKTVRPGVVCSRGEHRRTRLPTRQNPRRPP